MATMDYKGYELYQTPTKEFDLQKPSTYNFAQSLNQGFAARNSSGGLINDIITGAMNYSPLGVIPAVITAPYDRQSDFLTTMNDAGMNPSGPQGQPTTDATVDTGTLAGAVNMGNGLIGLPNGNVMDHTGSVVGGVVVDGNGNPVTTGNGSALGWGVGVAPNYGSTAPTGTVETLSADDPMGYGYGNPTGADLDTGVISNSDPNAPGNFGYGTTATTTAPAPVSTAPATRGISTETAPSTSSNDSFTYFSTSLSLFPRPLFILTISLLCLSTYLAKTISVITNSPANRPYSEDIVSNTLFTRHPLYRFPLSDIHFSKVS